MIIFKAKKCEDEKKPNLQTQLSNIIHRIFTYKLSDFPWMKEDDNNNNMDQSLSLSLSSREIKKRMSGISIYKVSNPNSENDFCFRSHDGKNREIELNFVSKLDALSFMGAISFYHARDWRIFDIPLSEHINLDEGKEASIRLVPESSQVLNAIQVMKKKDVIGSADAIISGVPVFQWDNLRMRTKAGRLYRLAYLRKEDLEDTISTVNGLGEPQAIQVSTLEDVIQEMKDSSTYKSKDIVFVGPEITSSYAWLREHEYD